MAVLLLVDQTRTGIGLRSGLVWSRHRNFGRALLFLRVETRPSPRDLGGGRVGVLRGVRGLVGLFRGEDT